MHAAIVLVISIVLAIHLVLPLGTWIMLSGRRDDKTRLWFIGTTLFSLSMCTVALRPYVSEFISFTLPWIMAIAAWLVVIETFRRELQRRASTWKLILCVIASWMLYLLWVFKIGEIKILGGLSYSLLFLLLSLYLLYLLFELDRLYRSKSISLLKISLFLYSAIYVNRIYHYLIDGSANNLNVFSLTWVSNLVVVGSILAIILLCIGYWGFTLEKSGLETQHAESQTESMRQLIKERDQLLMLNARVSAISSLSSFSAMLVHDISQPLQALEFGLYELQSQATPDQTADHLRHNIHELQQLSTKAGEMVSHLRQLMGRGQDHVSAIDPHMALQPILPILQGEALQRGIALTYKSQLNNPTRIMSNVVMLQRIVFNAVGNALDALQDQPKTQACIQIQLYTQVKAHETWTVLEIADNGPGFSEDVLSQLSAPIQSTKPHGMGLGLMLTQSMVRMWGGHTQIDNHPAGQIPGGLLQIWLRTAADEKSI